MLIDGDDGIADDIRAALTGNTEQVTEVDPAKEQEVDLPAATQNEPEEGKETRTRGPDGKFVAKTEEVAQDTTDQPSGVVAEPPSQAVTRPPSSWSPEAKAEFANLAPHVQAAIAKREQEIDQGLRKKAEEVKRYEPLESVLAPRRALWAAQGMDEASAVKTLLAAQDLLEQDPRKGLEFLARSYGVDLAQPQGQAQQPQPAGQPSELTALQQELADLKRQIASQSEAGFHSQIEAFRNDPANLYFENVRDEMAVLIQTGKAKDLPEAYDMACWMRPDIRPLLQQAQTRVAPDPAEIARKKAAGASVTGSPAEAQAAFKPNGTIEDDIRAAAAELSGR